MVQGQRHQRLAGGALIALQCCSLVVVVCLPRLTVSAGIHDADAEAFIGWRGETYKPEGVLTGNEQNPDPAKRPWIESISWKPRAYIFHNFLTEEECIHLKRLAAPTMRRSTVVSANGSSVTDNYRTSYGTFIRRNADEIVQRVDERLALWARIPPQHGEDLQVLRYGVGQYYKPHMDTLKDNDAGPRVATVLVYLNDVQEGGETAFPHSRNWLHPEQEQTYSPEFSDCAKKHVGIRPRKGDAMMFWSIKPDGQTEDPYAMHTGCPVLRGVKWTATKWFHAHPFRPATFNGSEPEPTDPGLCEDSDPGCQGWADSGECQKNAPFMMGDVGATGHCRAACKACAPCPKDDKACYDENRRSAGYLVFDYQELSDHLM